MINTPLINDFWEDMQEQKKQIESSIWNASVCNFEEKKRSLVVILKFIWKYDFMFLNSNSWKVFFSPR